ncbi:MAG: SCO family protein [Cognaticolwellia sp.]
MLKNLAVLLFISSLGMQTAHAEEKLPIYSGVGGNFSAVNQDGKTIEFNDFKGQPVLLTFGYTNCADICPFTLGYLSRIYAGLTKDEQKKINVVFVTVDPEYDTPEHLKKFMAHFNSEFIGLSGTKPQIDNIVSLFQAKYKKLSAENMVPTKNIRQVTQKTLTDESNTQEDKSSLYSHTVTIYLIDKSGFTRSIEYTGTPQEEFVGKIRGLINE